jgi:hypothetical protein
LYHLHIKKCIFRNCVSGDAGYLSGFVMFSAIFTSAEKLKRSQSLAIIQTTDLPVLNSAMGFSP